MFGPFRVRDEISLHGTDKIEVDTRIEKSGPEVVAIAVLLPLGMRYGVTQWEDADRGSGKTLETKKMHGVHRTVYAVRIS